MSIIELNGLVGGSEPSALAGYLATLGLGVEDLGSTTPASGGDGDWHIGPGGIAVPASESAGPMEFFGWYVTLSLYSGVAEDDRVAAAGLVIDDVLARHARPTLMSSLCFLASAATDLAKTQDFTAAFVDYLQAAPANRLQGVLADEQARILSRQPILAAVRVVLARAVAEDADLSDPRGPETALLDSGLLVHAVADLLAADDSDERIAGLPRSLFRELLCSAALNARDDVWASIDRMVRLWRDAGSSLRRTPVRAELVDLLLEATTLAPEELMALGFAVLTHAKLLAPGDPRFLSLETVGMSSSSVMAFLDVVSATELELAESFEERGSSPYDFLPVQISPVLRTDLGVIAIDSDFLWDRVTTGLYWLVHDYEKSRSERDRLVWTQAYAEAVEMLAEESFRVLAPHALGGGSAIFFEEDLRSAYGDGKVSDVVVDFGLELVVAEVVSGQLTVATRAEGDLDAFRADTQRLVVGKCEQLDATAHSLLDDPAALTGYEPPGPVTIWPVLVVGGGYPVFPATVSFVRELLAESGLLIGPRLQSLSIITMEELEQLEGCLQRGLTLVEVLTRWKQSDLAEVSLKNFMYRDIRGNEPLRPPRMDESVNRTFNTIKAILDLPDGTDQAS